MVSEAPDQVSVRPLRLCLLQSRDLGPWDGSRYLPLRIFCSEDGRGLDAVTGVERDHVWNLEG